MKKLLLVFVIAFILNFIWEYLHSLLYGSNMGGPITGVILFIASVLDAIIIVIISAPFIYKENYKKLSWLIIVFGIIIAIVIEKFALATGMWTYNDYMPIIPYLSVGLTPTIQLGFLGYVSYRIHLFPFLK